MELIIIKFLKRKISFSLSLKNTKELNLLLIIISSTIVCFTSCKKFVEVSPPTTSVNGPIVFASDKTATAVLNGVYVQLSSTSYPGFQTSTTALWLGLSSDELTLWNGVDNVIQKSYYENNLSSNVAGGEMWTQSYISVITCNTIIEGLNNSSTLSLPVKKQLLGEAKFLRALFYFYLTNLYGDVPMPLTSDYKINSLIPKTSQTEVYNQIISDLIEAESSMSDQYVDASLIKGTSERTRPNKWVAKALLSRVYLYTKNWAKAEAKASEIIDNSSLFSVKDVLLKDVFLRNSKEAIWQLQPVTTGYNTNTWEGKFFILPSSGPSTDYPVYISSNLLKAFEPGDKRIINWIDSVNISGEVFHYPSKYKESNADAPVSEYQMVFRTAEQYLIRSEARAQVGDINGAASDLNVIRTRAGLSNTFASDKVSLIAAIQHDRQTELFCEYGHRWLDLKRTETIDQVMPTVSSSKGGVWKSTSQLYPIPLGEIQKNHNLSQNAGY